MKENMNAYREKESLIWDLIDSDNLEEAYTLLRKGESEGDKDSIAFLGLFYIFGIGVKQDLYMGMEFVNKAISMGCAEVANEVGTLYERNDFGIPISRTKALEYYEKGVTLGNSQSYALAGRMYLRTDEMVRNDSKAAEYSKIAAKAGRVLGMYCIGLCYADGIGIKKSASDAIYWFREYLKYEPDDEMALNFLAYCLADPLVIIFY